MSMSYKTNNFSNLLVISVNAWSDQNSVGNTISNHFGGWDKSKLSNIYLRDEEIDNDNCFKYFKISEKDILNTLFKKQELGVEVKNLRVHFSNTTKNKSKISKLRDFLIRIRPTSVLLFRELFWKIGFIRKNELNDFLINADPEVIHIHCPNLIYAHRVLHYCHKKTKAKVVLFFGDEIYSYKNYWPLSFLYQLILSHWIRKTIQISDLNYAATPELCEYYSNLFGKEFKILYKGTFIIQPEIKQKSKPLSLVYAGNLLYGRAEVLASLIAVIDKEFKDNEFNLSIYTGTIISNEMSNKLNTSFSKVFPAISFEKIKQILKDADIVLHVESFKKEFRKITKYSFSTKIVDCIQSGNCIMGVGPADLASIGFIKNTEAAIVATSLDEIVVELRKVVKNNEILDIYSEKMYAIAKTTFDLEKIRENIYCDIQLILDK
jgi:hypothetical protein